MQTTYLPHRARVIGEIMIAFNPADSNFKQHLPVNHLYIRRMPVFCQLTIVAFVLNVKQLDFET